MPTLHLIRVRRLLMLCLSCVLSLFIIERAFAEDAEGKSPPVLPTDPSVWLNTSPLTWEQLSGKGVVLYYFSCDPEGAADLPKVIEAARTHAVDPVILIGVTMGNTRQETEAYLKTIGFQWPVLCDPVYSFTHLTDKALESEESNLLSECLTGVCYVTATGVSDEGDWEDPKSTFKDVLEGAAWITDPKDIPAPVLPAWRAVELKKYAEALPLLKKGVNAGSNEQKEAARQLQQVVLKEIERLVGEARAADEQDQKWNAYRKIGRILDEFRGYDIPKDLEPLQKKLAKTSQVKQGLTAEKQLGIAAQGLKSPNAVLRKKAEVQLEKIVADFPESDLAKNARKLIDDSQQKSKK